MAGSPTLRRRRLSAELLRLREAAGITATAAAKRLDWHPSKLTRMERNEWRRPLPRDVVDLLDLYGITDEGRRERLVTLAKEGRQRGWWHPYEAELSDQYTTYIGLEAEAASVLSFEALMVPGLVQTDDYAREVMRSGQAEIADDEVERRVELRLARQRVLTRDDPLRLSVVFDEAVLHRVVGSPEIMRVQFRHLLEMAKHPRVTLQAIPFTAGAHPGVLGPFAILRFADPADPEAVYVENLAGELFVEEPVEVERFQIAFQRLVAVALSPKDTIKLIADKL
ncbi:helix-turn-helix domain-containing protein [Actinomadura macra]|uniref:helix-turn-helix domain-containing protein n=1 Tax=Actinomadura macra TaxID=46164 RepID=UPI00082D0356|nr:helix-turn-helix transcriptional regulator [Actinomadura macra]